MVKRDCYYFYEEPHVGAHIPQCRLHAYFGQCPCVDKNDCNQYVSREDVNKLVQETLNHNAKEIDF